MKKGKTPGDMRGADRIMIRLCPSKQLVPKSNFSLASKVSLLKNTTERLAAVV